MVNNLIRKLGIIVSIGLISTLTFIKTTKSRLDKETKTNTEYIKGNDPYLKSKEFIPLTDIKIIPLNLEDFALSPNVPKGYLEGRLIRTIPGDPLRILSYGGEVYVFELIGAPNQNKSKLAKLYNPQTGIRIPEYYFNNGILPSLQRFFSKFLDGGEK